MLMGHLKRQYNGFVIEVTRVALLNNDMALKNYTVIFQHFYFEIL